MQSSADRPSNDNGSSQDEKEGEQRQRATVIEIITIDSTQVSTQTKDIANTDDDDDIIIKQNIKRDILLSSPEQDDSPIHSLSQVEIQGSPDMRDGKLSQHSIGVQCSQQVTACRKEQRSIGVQCSGGSADARINFDLSGKRDNKTIRKITNHVVSRENGVSVIKWEVEETCQCSDQGLKRRLLIDTDSVLEYGRALFDYLFEIRKQDLIEFQYITTSLM